MTNVEREKKDLSRSYRCRPEHGLVRGYSSFLWHGRVPVPSWCQAGGRKRGNSAGSASLPRKPLKLVRGRLMPSHLWRDYWKQMSNEPFSPVLGRVIVTGNTRGNSGEQFGIVIWSRLVMKMYLCSFHFFLDVEQISHENWCIFSNSW